MSFDVEACRRQFPALRRQHGDRTAVYLDGPAGTQTPQCVIDAIVHYLSCCNANHGGLFATSQESDALLDQAHQAAADLLGVDDPDTICFGANMTSLTFAFSRALARTWSLGDEVIVTRLDHDANVTPWVMAARDADVQVRTVELRDDCTLDLDDYRCKLSERTRLVAIGCASNATGGVNPVREMCDLAHAVGALTYLDAVHYAPHRLIDVAQLGGDFLSCSAYKFFGPHIGMLWGRRELMESLEAYKVRPAENSIPGRWMTGTQNHECLVGVTAAINYLAEIGSPLTANASRREALQSSYQAIAAYERDLCARLLSGLAEIPAIRVWGEAGADRLDDRVSTVSITHQRLSATDVALKLGEQGLYVWHGNYYALSLTEALGLEPDGMVRLGLLHYNTEAEVDSLLDSLRAL